MNFSNRTLTDTSIPNSPFRKRRQNGYPIKLLPAPVKNSITGRITEFSFSSLPPGG